jgi:hypothetical protein
MDFPKGCIEPGLTYAQSAALEAFEEQSAWPPEEVGFARYILRKRGKLRQMTLSRLLPKCHLCEVLRLNLQELNRNPTGLSRESQIMFKGGPQTRQR